jgi:hypothetical protein
MALEVSGTVRHTDVAALPPHMAESRKFVSHLDADNASRFCD